MVNVWPKRIPMGLHVGKQQGKWHKIRLDSRKLPDLESSFIVILNTMGNEEQICCVKISF